MGTGLFPLRVEPITNSMESACMAINISSEDGKIVIQVAEEFKREDIPAFCGAYESAPTNTAFIIDLKGVDYIDSTFLGQVSALRRHTGGEKSNITIVNASPMVTKLLHVVKYDLLVRIL